MERNRPRYKLLKIILNNFRVYSKETIIEFGIDDNKRITIIEGANGTGKTTLLNAITWCLYGKELHLPPATRIKKEYEIRPNLHMIKNYPSDRIVVSVELIFGDEKGNPIFNIKRKENYEKIFDKVERIGEEFTILKREGYNWKTITDTNIFLAMFLPENIHEFYFFDGEQLDEFFREKSSEKVKKAIEKLSQLDLLDRAIEHLNVVKQEILKSLKASSPRVDQKKKELDHVYTEIEKIKERLKENKEQISKIENLIREKDNKLNEIRYEEIKQLLNKRIQLESELNKQEKELKELKEKSIYHLIRCAPFVYCEDSLKNLVDQIDKMIYKGELPPDIKQEFIDKLLQQGECICGTLLLPNSPQRAKLEEYRSSTLLDELSIYILENKRVINKILDDIRSFHEERMKYGKDINSIEEKIYEINRQLKDISEKLIDENIHNEIRELELERTDLYNRKGKLDEQIGWDESLLDQKEKEMKKLESELRDEMVKEEKAKKITYKYELCENAINQLIQIKDELINKIRNEVKEKTNQYFRDLIWKRYDFSSIEIDENYEIRVLDNDGNNRLGVLSAGEREVLTLSFIAALRDVIDIRLPIVMDTPLARISGEPRKNIARLLPTYLNDTQLILLLTDQEYTIEVRGLLKDYVGKELVLEFDSHNQQTTIKERKGVL
ncbi:MAG: AAA family ATPase [Candidatus Nitrosocaldaceae archaeon]